ncbi:MAG: transmembrane amino acid transporter protein-domain-containing protein [Linnemannia gamsii]|nr:MAG: transmembrane amino acid transporter protein-domain-containing protein [Linnemannia gamsii]
MPPSRSNSMDRPGSGNCSIMEVSFNILNCTVGSGILALSFAIKESGFGLGIVLSVAVAVLTWMALYILIISGKKINVFKYAILCEATMGRFGFYLLNSVIFFQSAGACITYMIVVGDTIPIILDILGFWVSRRWVILVSSILFILPLLFYRSIGSLAKVSMISVMTLPPILFAVAVRGMYYAPEHKRSYDFVGNNVFPAIGVMAFAMLSTQTAFLNFTTMAQPTRKAWGQATGIAVSLSWLISFVFAIIGFMAFGEDVQPNIFNSFPQTDGLINFGRGLLGFSMFLTFPQAFYPARAALHKVLGHEDNHIVPTDSEHFYTTLALFFPILVCGVFIADLGLLYQLIGGFCSTFLAYIIPGACYFLIFWRKDPSSLRRLSKLPSSDSLESDASGGESNATGAEEERGRESRYEDDEDSLENIEDADGDEEERLLKHKLAQDKKSELGLEEEGFSGRQYGHRPSGNYGATASTRSSRHQLHYGSSDGSTPSTADLLRTGSSHTASAGGRKTELWLDVSAGILLVFGVFVMVISTTLTLKRMAGYV